MTHQNRIELFNLADAWRIIKRRKWLLVIPTIVTSVVVFIGSQFLTPFYQSSTIILLDREVRLTSELQVLLGLNRNTYRSQDALMDELRSYRNVITSSVFMLQLAERLKLDNDVAIQGQVDQTMQSSPGISREQALGYVLKREIGASIAVASAGADQIQLTAESKSQVLAQDIANTLSEIFVEELLKQDVARVRTSQNFADIQLEKYEQLLKDKIEERTNFEKGLLRNRLDTVVMSEGNRSQVRAEIDQTEQDITENQNIERQLLIQLNAVDKRLSINPLIISDSKTNRQTKDRLKEQLQALGDLLQRNPWSDPQMLSIRLRQNSLISSIDNENRKLVGEQFPGVDDGTKQLLIRLSTIRSTLDFLVSKVHYLRAALDQIEDQINRIPESQATRERLNREITSATELRDKFRNQQEGSTISQALLQDLSSTKYRIIERAKLPLSPVKPNRLNISLMGVLLGIVIGVSVALVTEFMDTSYRKPTDLEEDLDVKVLGVVPKIELLSVIKKQLTRS